MSGTVKSYEFQGDHDINEVAKTEIACMAASVFLRKKDTFNVPIIATRALSDGLYEYNQSLGADAWLPNIYKIPASVANDDYKLASMAVGQKITCVSVAQSLLLSFYGKGGVVKNFMEHIWVNSAGMICREVARNIM